MNSTETRHLSESEVVRIWQKQMMKQRHLDDSEGQPVEIIYPGRLNDGRGGDFRDAVVASGSEYKSGYIEIHTRASCWRTHGHHRDPVYNQVVLHVAMEQDRPGKAVLQNGQLIPTVILNKYLNYGLQNGTAELLCKMTAARSTTLVEYLDRAGEWRFLTQASRYQTELAQIEAGQCLYQGILEALGYTKNKKPFRELARRVPLHIPYEIVETGGLEEDILARLQALFLGNAGFLFSPRSIRGLSEKQSDTLKRMWSDLPQSNAMSIHDWELFKVRPGNSPVRRIVALSHLIYRCREQGWLHTLLNLIRKIPADHVQHELELAFMVNGEDCPVLLGRDRAAEIVTNVLLPFAWSWSRMESEPRLNRKIMEIYSRHPRMESNSIERHMLNQLALDRRQVNSARRQQGLIHIYKTLCIQGKCRECGFGGGE